MGRFTICALFKRTWNILILKCLSTNGLGVLACTRFGTKKLRFLLQA